MTLLLLGLLGWSFFHLFKSLFPQARAALDDKFGQGAAKGAFSVLILLSLLAIVFGWQMAPANLLYIPAPWTGTAASVLMLLSLLLFVASLLPSRVSCFVRHPQLTAVLLWSVAHLLCSGGLRSAVLFGVMAVWALVSIVAINRRDGAWQKPTAPGLKQDFLLLIATAVVYLLVAYAHPWLSGVALF